MARLNAVGQRGGEALVAGSTGALMIVKETVFVLGAGASWHYGYPTGEGLIDHVMQIAERLRSHCDWRLYSGNMPVQFVPLYIRERIDGLGTKAAAEAWRTVRDECRLLVERLVTVRPLVIDYFLAWNESLRPIGKLMIAAAILECEAVWHSTGKNQNNAVGGFKDDWYRFIVHKLVYGCTKSEDIFLNKVRFVTFNYDASLEYHLYRALTSIDLFGAADIARFLAEDRIVHVYGTVHKAIPTKDSVINLSLARELRAVPETITEGWLREIEFLLNKYHNSAEALLTIDPHDKENATVTLGRARDWIEAADVVYVLGYGFDPNNSRRIGLNNLFKRATPRKVMFTNFGDINTISKKASNQFFGNSQTFIDRAIFLAGNGYAEKSVRNVYDAFEKDFDAIEMEASQA